MGIPAIDLGSLWQTLLSPWWWATAAVLLVAGGLAYRFAGRGMVMGLLLAAYGAAIILTGAGGPTQLLVPAVLALLASGAFIDRAWRARRAGQLPDTGAGTDGVGA